MPPKLNTWLSETSRVFLSIGPISTFLAVERTINKKRKQKRRERAIGSFFKPNPFSHGSWELQFEFQDGKTKKKPSAFLLIRVHFESLTTDNVYELIQKRSSQNLVNEFIVHQKAPISAHKLNFELFVFST